MAHILGVLKHLILLYLKTSIQEMTIISHFIVFENKYTRNDYYISFYCILISLLRDLFIYTSLFSPKCSLSTNISGDELVIHVWCISGDELVILYMLCISGDELVILYMFCVYQAMN